MERARSFGVLLQTLLSYAPSTNSHTVILLMIITLQRNIEVRWRAPERPNGEIIGYKIVHTPPGANVTVGAETLSYNIRGLG